MYFESGISLSGILVYSTFLISIIFFSSSILHNKISPSLKLNLSRSTAGIAVCIWFRPLFVIVVVFLIFFPPVGRTYRSYFIIFHSYYINVLYKNIH